MQLLDPKNFSGHARLTEVLFEAGKLADLIIGENFGRRSLQLFNVIYKVIIF